MSVHVNDRISLKEQSDGRRVVTIDGQEFGGPIDELHAGAVLNWLDTALDQLEEHFRKEGAMEAY